MHRKVGFHRTILIQVASRGTKSCEPIHGLCDILDGVRMEWEGKEREFSGYEGKLSSGSS
jgi:hypothetical protein